jgi:hypothetical protein
MVVVGALLSVQKQKETQSDITKRIACLENQINNLVNSLADTGNSEHVSKAIIDREAEWRQLNLALTASRKPLSADGIAARVLTRSTGPAGAAEEKTPPKRR